jgi:hypothetical protein
VHNRKSIYVEILIWALCKAHLPLPKTENRSLSSEEGVWLGTALAAASSFLGRFGEHAFNSK